MHTAVERPFRRHRLAALLALVVAAALVAGCTASSTTLGPEATESASQSQEAQDGTQGGTEPEAAVEPAPGTADEPPEPEPAPEPAAEPEPDEATSFVPGPYTGSPVSGFVAPDGWDRPLPLTVDTFETTLDNGVRVLVRTNDSPGLQAQFRLVVTAGSVHEDEDNLGAAHFLEHMMFNGTERFPDNELIPVLEGFGAGFGPDINAYTSFDETVYQLKVPATDYESLTLAIDVLTEWASAATIEPDAVAAERGVVREEYRISRETADGRLRELTNGVLFADTNRLDRYPIGTLDSIDEMTAEELRAFYETWYRPEHMTVIAVGDFDPIAMVESISGPFSQLESSGPLPERPAIPVAAGRAEAVYDVITDPELTRTQTRVQWQLPGTHVVNRIDMRDEYVRLVALTLLNQRFFEATQRGGTALSTNASWNRVTAELLGVIVQTNSDTGDVEAAVGEALTLVEQLRQHPAGADEFARTIERLRATADQREAAIETRQDREIANGLVEYSLTDSRGAITSQENAAVNAVLDSIEPVDVQVFFDTLLESEPYILVTGPAGTDELPEPEALAESYDSHIGWNVAAPEVGAESIDTLMDRPPPAYVVDRSRIEALDATVVTYENGARLAFKPTSIVRNSVEFQGWSRGGFFHENEAIAPLLGRAESLVMPSGFDTIDPVELDRILTGAVVSLSGSVGRAEETLWGDAAVGDVETLFQLINRQMTESTINELQVRRFDEGWRPIAEQPESIPEVAADLELWRLRYGDSPWFRLLPTVEDLDALDRDAQLDAWQRRYANAGDFIFVFVGDIDPESIIDLGARYLGTLPSAPEREGQIDRDPGVPEANLVATVAAGVGDQGRLRINWESPYPFTIEAEVAAQVLEVVVDARLRDLVREQLGASYSPTAAVTLLSEPKPWVDTIIELNGDPDRLEEISQVISDELTRIRAGEIDPQYLELAVGQLAEDWQFFSNGNWMDLITFHVANPDRAPDEYRQRTEIARALTIADLAETAQVVFPATRSVEVRMVPAG